MITKFLRTIFVCLILQAVCFGNSAQASFAEKEPRTKFPVFARVSDIAQRPVDFGPTVNLPEENEIKREKAEKETSAPRLIPQHYITEDKSIRESSEITEKNLFQTNSLFLFKGIIDIGNFENQLPADPIMAAGPNQVIAAVNKTIAIFNKDGTRVFQTGLATWFSSLPDAVGKGLFDPRLTYDQYNGHFIFICAAAGGSDHRSLVLFSVSKTSDATGEWAFWTLDMQLNNHTHVNVFADFPGVGYDTEAIYVTANMFNLSPFHYASAKIRVLKKSEVYSFQGITWHDFWNFRDATGAKAINVEPAQNFGTIDREYLLSSNAVHGDKLTLYTITDPTGSPAFQKTPVQVSSYRIAPNAEQRGGTVRLNSGDAGLTNVVCVNGTTLYAANAVKYDWGKGANAAARFYIISTTGTVIEETTFGGPGYYYYYPVVMVDSQNNIVMAFNRSSANTFAGIFFTTRKATDPAGFFGPDMRIKSGIAYYNIPTQGGFDLWGDFNGIALDSDDSIWMFSMYAKTSHQWGTRGARFHF